MHGTKYGVHVDVIQLDATSRCVEREDFADGVNEINLDAWVDPHGIAEHERDSGGINVTIMLKVILVDEPSRQILMQALIGLLVVHPRRKVNAEDRSDGQEDADPQGESGDARRQR